MKATLILVALVLTSGPAFSAEDPLAGCWRGLSATLYYSDGSSKEMNSRCAAQIGEERFVSKCIGPGGPFTTQYRYRKLSDDMYEMETVADLKDPKPSAAKAVYEFKLKGDRLQMTRHFEVDKSQVKISPTMFISTSIRETGDCNPRDANVSTVRADASGVLNGTWVLDAKATEESVLASPPYKAAKWFGLASPYLVVFIYEFDGDDAAIYTFGRQDKREYRLQSRQGAQLTYIPKSTQAAPDAFTVSTIGDNNIKISHSGSPEMSHILWKRVKLDPKQTTPYDSKPGMDAWIASLQKIIPVLNTPPNPTGSTDAAR